MWESSQNGYVGKSLVEELESGIGHLCSGEDNLPNGADNDRIRGRLWLRLEIGPQQSFIVILLTNGCDFTRRIRGRTDAESLLDDGVSSADASDHARHASGGDLSDLGRCWKLAKSLAVALDIGDGNRFFVARLFQLTWPWRSAQDADAFVCYARRTRHI